MLPSVSCAQKNVHHTTTDEFLQYFVAHAGADTLIGKTVCVQHARTNSLGGHTNLWAA